MKNKLATKSAFLVLLFVMFSSGVAYADTITLRISALATPGVTVLITDNQAGDTDSRVGFITYSGQVGSFYLLNAKGSTEEVITSVGRDFIQTLGVQNIQHFSTAPDQLVLTLQDTGTYPYAVTKFSGNITSTTVGATSASFQSWIGGTSLYDTPVVLGTGTNSYSEDLSLESPAIHKTQATLNFGSGGVASFTFKSIVDPPGVSVPEPLSLLLLGTGLVGLGLLRQKRGNRP